MKIIKNEQGFVVSVTAIIIAVILGLIVLFFANSIALNVTTASDIYSSTQARWTAVSGVDLTLMKLNNLYGEEVKGNFPFMNSEIVIDTSLIDSVNKIWSITSTGVHASSYRILSMYISPSAIDTAISEDFDSEVDLVIRGQPGEGEARYWGISCDTASAEFLPTYIFLNSGDCFFFGNKAQNNSTLYFDPIDVSDMLTVGLELTIAAGVDVPNPSEQNLFQNMDYVEVLINGMQLEKWEGPSGAQGPMSPTVGNATEDLLPTFQRFDFNLSEIFGELDTLDIEIIGNENALEKYAGVSYLSLITIGYYSIMSENYKEI
ncbi:MAG: hypothetical protein V3S42_05355 [Candidatus Neomarinimicrobiota bacterium]